MSVETVMVIVTSYGQKSLNRDTTRDYHEMVLGDLD